MNIKKGGKVGGILIILFFFVAGSIAQSLEEINDLMDQSYKEGNYDFAIKYGEKALKQCINEFGKEHAKYGETLDRLALTYKNMGQYEKALVMIEECLVIIEMDVGKENPEYDENIYCMGLLHKNLGQYEKALNYLT